MKEQLVDVILIVSFVESKNKSHYSATTVHRWDYIEKELAPLIVALDQGAVEGGKMYNK